MGWYWPLVIVVDDAHRCLLETWNGISEGFESFVKRPIKTMDEVRRGALVCHSDRITAVLFPNSVYYRISGAFYQAGWP